MNNGINLEMKREAWLAEVLENAWFLSMDMYRHHGQVSCLEHTLSVAALTYSLAKRAKLDFISATRGALLHDFYLYDWHTDSPGLHGFKHPYISLRNASQQFTLNAIEQNAILRHMWPLTPIPPKYPESLLVSLADKAVTFKDYRGLISILPWLSKRWCGENKNQV
jgi:uncharacterized protein